MTAGNGKKSFIFSALIFIFFFSYYFVTANLLPHGAGPDWRSNTDVSAFIYEHGRLAVLPDDEGALHFTVYGGTRAFRPPFSYIVSAASAHVLSFTGIDQFVLFRTGSALLCALAVALAFYALSLYLNSYGAGLLGAAAIGLMPQYVFIASYSNDDSGAIFSATLMLTVLVRIYRYGANTSNAVLTGLAGGLVILSKMSAWLLLPFVLVCLVFFFRAPLRDMLRHAVIAAIALIVAGGWWIGFNMYHYGPDDPIQRKIAADVIERHRRLPPDTGVGYAAHGIGYYELILENYRNFLGETAKATIGNLDWLKLRVGPMQYNTYLALFYLALLFYLAGVSGYALALARGSPLAGGAGRRTGFETILLAIITFQLFMYVWTNIHNDIQVQGKYIIPVFLAVLLLFFSGLLRLAGLAGRVCRMSTGRDSRLCPGIRVAAQSTVLVFLLWVHWDAWDKYVIPFYKPAYFDLVAGDFRVLELDQASHKSSANIEIRQTPEGLEYLATGEDPRIELTPAYCEDLSGKVMLRLLLHADKEDRLQLFIDEGKGYLEKQSYKADYKPGDNVINITINAKNCHRIRLDPSLDRNRVLLKKVEVAEMKFIPRSD
jgi:hypothetical protein